MKSKVFFIQNDGLPLTRTTKYQGSFRFSRTRFRFLQGTVGIKAMPRGISKGKTSDKICQYGNGVGVCLFSQNETKCTVRVSTGFTSLLLAMRTSTFATACKKSNNDSLSLLF